MFGYKAFKKGLLNRYNEKFNIGEEKSILGEIRWGTTGNGYHFCEEIEDCFRYVDAFNEEIDLALVEASGSIINYDDEYYGYYKMHAASNIKVIRVLEREEIINSVLEKNNFFSYQKFLSTYPVTKSELKLFLDKCDSSREKHILTCYYEIGKDEGEDFSRSRKK